MPRWAVFLAVVRPLLPRLRRVSRAEDREERELARQYALRLVALVRTRPVQVPAVLAVVEELPLPGQLLTGPPDELDFLGDPRER